MSFTHMSLFIELRTSNMIQAIKEKIKDLFFQSFRWHKDKEKCPFGKKKKY